MRRDLQNIPEKNTSWIGHISLLTVSVDNILVDLLQDEFHGFFKVRNVSHFEFGSISQEGDHVTIPEQSLDGSDFNNIWVNDFRHILSANTGCDTDAARGNSVTDPRLASPGSNGGDNSDNGQDGDGWNNGFGDGGRSFVEFFFRSKRDGGLCGLGSGGPTLSLSALDLNIVGINLAITNAENAI